MWGVLKQILFPSSCVSCGRWDSLLCEQCEHQISYVIQQHCPGCRATSIAGYTHGACRRKSNLDGLYSICWFREPIRSLINSYKYGSYIVSLESVISNVIQSAWIDIDEAWWSDTLLIPVPLHTRRQRDRGFNQAERIAEMMAGIVDCPLDTNILQRVRYTTKQSRLSRVQRKQNVSSAFVINKDLVSIEYQSIVLVDDVYTSGSTLEACAKALRTCYTGCIYGFTFARG